MMDYGCEWRRLSFLCLYLENDFLFLRVGRVVLEAYSDEVPSRNWSHFMHLADSHYLCKMVELIPAFFKTNKIMLKSCNGFGNTGCPWAILQNKWRIKRLLHLRFYRWFMWRGPRFMHGGAAKSGTIGINHCIMDPLQRFTTRRKGNCRIQTHTKQCQVQKNKKLSN